MGFNDYGTTPNVWRPSDVPYPNTGEDTGVGPKQSPGQDVTTETTDDFPIIPGWNLIEDFTTAGTGSTTNVLVKTIKMPLNYAMQLWTVYFKTWNGIGTGGSSTARFSVNWPNGNSFIDEVSAVTQGLPLLPGNFTRHMLQVRLSISGMVNVPGTPTLGLVSVHTKWSQATSGTPQVVAGTNNPTLTSANMTANQWNRFGQGIDDIANFSETVSLALNLRITSSGTITDSPLILGGVSSTQYNSNTNVEEVTPRFIIMGM